MLLTTPVLMDSRHVRASVLAPMCFYVFLANRPKRS
jgi:hypothetical protein